MSDKLMKVAVEAAEKVADGFRVIVDRADKETYKKWVESNARIIQDTTGLRELVEFVSESPCECSISAQRMCYRCVLLLKYQDIKDEIDPTANGVG